MINLDDKYFIARFYSLWILSWWLYMFFSRNLLHFAGQIVFIPTDIDFFFVILNNFGIIRSIFQNQLICSTIDYGILLLSIITLCFPLKGKFYFILSLILGLFDIGYTCASFHHQHGLYSIIIMALSLSFIGKEKEFPYIWRAARYLPILIYIMAFYWKIKGGVLFYPQQGVAVLKSNLAYILLYLSHKNIFSQIIAFFLRHPNLLQIFYVSGLFMEGLFVIGLFTRKADLLLLILGLLLHLFICIFVDAYFVSHCILFFPLLPLEKIRKTKIYQFLVCPFGLFVKS